MVCPDNVSIEDESIDHALGNSEVEDVNNDNKQESCSYKENEECQVVAVWAVDALRRTNSQTVVVLAATTQSTNSIKGTLGVGVIL